MDVHAATAEQFDDATQQRETATLGMWAFLATEILFFGVLFAGYTVCRVRFPLAFAAGCRHTDMLFGTLETAVLLTSSCALPLGGSCLIRAHAALVAPKLAADRRRRAFQLRADLAG